ncbi:unnamed protein product [Spirodela intermedia]|uniref:Uncharacterized protein n=1 Tax=Spirodela intermedia TaxID=51605 RepID=A0A7I8IIL5_SPIIN|nr:unnamed protein product [Spirodela intermedia]CAA6657330.1 unnamed protein product [Spirodela intermedia]
MKMTTMMLMLKTQRAMAPQDTDWLIPLGAILVALFALICVMVFIFTRRGNCREHGGCGSQGETLFGHECLAASLSMLLLVVLSLAGLYYLFCFRGGCYGAALTEVVAGAAGRKAKVTTQ